MFASVVKGSIITKETQKQVRTAFMRVVTLRVDGKKSTKYLNYIKRF